MIKRGVIGRGTINRAVDKITSKITKETDIILTGIVATDKTLKILIHGLGDMTEALGHLIKATNSLIQRVEALEKKDSNDYEIDKNATFH